MSVIMVSNLFIFKAIIHILILNNLQENVSTLCSVVRIIFVANVWYHFRLILSEVINLNFEIILVKLCRHWACLLKYFIIE